MDDYIAMQFPKLPPHIRHLYREETMLTSPEWVSEKKPYSSGAKSIFHHSNASQHEYEYVQIRLRNLQPHFKTLWSITFICYFYAIK